MKKSLCIFWLLISVFGCSHKNINRQPNDNTVITINSIATLESYVIDNSLVLLDLDHTVFQSAEIYGHANWFYDRLEEGKKQGIDTQETIKKIYPQWIAAQERNRVIPVEPLTPDLIARLQQRGVNVMGLTARQTSLIDATLRQLSEIKINFATTSLMPAIFPAAEFMAPVAFCQGILFASEFVKKSTLLKAYLDRIHYRPTRIIFVDDIKHHLNDMIATFAAEGIEIIALHYPLVEKNRHLWNKEKAADIFKERGQELVRSPLASSP